MPDANNTARGAPGKAVVGLVERVRVIGQKEKEVYALFDTGAKQSSIDTNLAAEIGVGPVIRTTKVKNPSVKLRMVRPVVRARIEIMGRVFETEANIQDRSHMTSPVLVGRNVIAGNFLVDPERNIETFRELSVKKAKADQFRS